MSKLSKVLTAKEGERVAVFNYASFDETWDSMKFIADSHRYTISAKMSVSVVVDDSSAKQGTPLTEAVRSAKRAIIEDMFGEFRQPLIEIDVAAMNRDYDKVRRLTNQLLLDMFDDR